MNGAIEAEELEETSSPAIQAPRLSGRMKHLLFGVRLSVAADPLPPADDLEDLARKLDGMRSVKPGRDDHLR